MSFPTPHDGSGTVLRFGSALFTVSNVVVTNTNPDADADSQVDVAHLGQSAGSVAARMARPLTVPDPTGASGRQITFDYIGKTILLDGSTGTVFIAIGGTALIGSTGASATSFIATVQSSTLTLATNDAVRGQGVLSLVRTASLT